MTTTTNPDKDSIVGKCNPDLFTDPALWVRKEYGDKAYQTHKKERIVRGWSRYDWYNFDTHFMWLAHNVARDVILSNINVDAARAPEVVAAAHNFLDLRQQLLDLTEVYYRGTISLKEEGRQIRILEQESASVFFGQIFPYLPYADDRYYTIPLGDGSARATHGYSLDDMEEIRSYLTSILVGGILMAASPAANGFNANFTEEEWRETLHKMAYALGTLQTSGSVEEILYPTADDVTGIVMQWKVDRQQQYAEGIQLLIEYHTSLWD